MMMMEIDKRDVEIVNLKSSVEMNLKSMKEMAEALQLCSENLFKILRYSDDDWTELKFIIQKYGLCLDESQEIQLRMVIPEFVRWKMGQKAADENA
jgi:hypothetical protein